MLFWQRGTETQVCQYSLVINLLFVGHTTPYLLHFPYVVRYNFLRRKKKERGRTPARLGDHLMIVLYRPLPSSDRQVRSGYTAKQFYPCRLQPAGIFSP